MPVDPKKDRFRWVFEVGSLVAMVGAGVVASLFDGSPLALVVAFLAIWLTFWLIDRELRESRSSTNASWQQRIRRRSEPDRAGNDHQDD